MARPLPDLRSDEGTTLVETMVAILIISILGAVVFAATLATQKSLRVSDDETQGQIDVSLAADLLSRDIRNARGVVCDGAAWDTACAAHLQLWVDTNSNYRQDSGETVTWRLQARTGTSQFDLIRTTNGGSTRTAARTIVQNVAFTYDRQPTASQPAPGQPTTRVVNVRMFYDAVPGSATSSRTIAFSTLVRNVP